MATAKQLLSHKGRTVYTISETATVFMAISKMVTCGVGSMVVTNKAEQPVGIFTERDYLERVALEGRVSKTTFVYEIMTPDPVYVQPDMAVEECMQVMSRQRIRHLLVLDQDRLAGVLSMGDIVSHLARERQSAIEELTGYIQGRY